MNTGPLWCVTVTTHPEAEEAVSELLRACFSAPASSYLDAESSRTRVSVYLARKPRGFRGSLRERLERARRGGLEVAPGTFSVRKMRGRDWATSWKRHFRPLEVGSALLIKPSWSRRRARSGQVEVVLDPGLSFGTGQHPTTLFCLRQLVWFRNPKTSQSLLDLGTGSGILAIAAVKLGYAPVRAVDLDPASVQIARANARRNRVERRVQIRKADVTRMPVHLRRSNDMVCANLSADLLISEHARIVKLVKPSGILVLAGILRSEFSRVARVYRSDGYRLIATRMENEWQGGAFRRGASDEILSGNG